MTGCLDDSAERALLNHFYLQACSLDLLFGKGDTLTMLVAVPFVFMNMAFVAIPMFMSFVTMIVLVSMRLMQMCFVVVFMLMLVSSIVLATTCSKKQSCTYTSQ